MYQKKLLNKFKRKGITEIVNNGNNTNFIVLGSFSWHTVSMNEKTKLKNQGWGSKIRNCNKKKKLKISYFGKSAKRREKKYKHILQTVFRNTESNLRR